MKKQIGGYRLGSGNKMEVEMKSYDRSTHDVGNVFRSSMSVGTLVPFMVDIGLPGDTWDINLKALIRTMPTTGSLFGSFKFQADVFVCPMRLFQGELHMNLTNVGLNMGNILLPRTIVEGVNANQSWARNGKFNQSCLMSYLGLRGVGSHGAGYTLNGLELSPEEMNVQINALPLLTYWEIFKQYYSNKQETNAFVITPKKDDEYRWNKLTIYTGNGGIQEEVIIGSTGAVTGAPTFNFHYAQDLSSALLKFRLAATTGSHINEDCVIDVLGDGIRYVGRIRDFKNRKGIPYFQIEKISNTVAEYKLDPIHSMNGVVVKFMYIYQSTDTLYDLDKIGLTSFPLQAIDDMRRAIMRNTLDADPWLPTNIEPYTWSTKRGQITGQMNDEVPFNWGSQNGLAVKTYNSDMFNNWLKTDAIIGGGSIQELSSINVESGYLTIDSITIAKRVYDLLNRVQLSGGSFQDWQEAVWGDDAVRMTESPIYCGGMSQEIVFEEVVSTADTYTTEGGIQPLGSLAGKGSGRDHKGGNVTIKIKEPSIVMGICSITPRIDYSDGNKWFNHLTSLDDLHKPIMDGIAFQDLITEGMSSEDVYNGNLKSAGKQPAWLHYMTNVNECYGDFAEPDKLMFMTLNRKYEIDYSDAGVPSIKDLTTYIDPSKYNYAFADSRIDAQNFWVQIGKDIDKRSIMSAKLMPNL